MCIYVLLNPLLNRQYSTLFVWSILQRYWYQQPYGRPCWKSEKKKNLTYGSFEVQRRQQSTGMRSLAIFKTNLRKLNFKYSLLLLNFGKAKAFRTMCYFERRNTKPCTCNSYGIVHDLDSDISCITLLSISLLLQTYSCCCEIPVQVLYCGSKTLLSSVATFTL